MDRRSVWFVYRIWNVLVYFCPFQSGMNVFMFVTFLIAVVSNQISPKCNDEDVNTIHYFIEYLLFVVSFFLLVLPMCNCYTNHMGSNKTYFPTVNNIHCQRSSVGFLCYKIASNKTKLAAIFIFCQEKQKIGSI